MMSVIFITVLNYKLSLVLFVIAVLGIYQGLRAKRDMVKHLLFNASAVVIAIAVFEGYLAKKDLYQSEFHIYDELVENEEGLNHSQDDEHLGYAAVTSGRFNARKKVRKTAEVVYEVIYNFKDGKRYTPSSNAAFEDCIQFLGCSYTFGHGLDDTATLPNYFGLLTPEPLRIVNHAFDGYGLHQVMEQVEQLVNEDEHCHGRKVVIYPHLLGHFSRAAGYASWDRFGPRYEIVNGKLEHKGPFEERSSFWVKYVDPYLTKSRIYKQFFKHYFRPITDQDIDRGLAIILECHHLLTKNNFEFEVFIYDINEHIIGDFGSYERYEKALEVLKKANVQLHFLSDVISDYDQHINKYTIGIHDRHPNALSNKLVATYFAKLYDQKGLSFSNK